VPALPTFNAGTEPTAGQLQTLLPIKAVKPADQTVNNSNVLVNDNALVLPVNANAIYDFQLRLVYSSGATPAFKFHFTLPSGGTMSYTTNVLSGGAFKLFANNDASTPTADGTGADSPILLVGEIFIAGTSGNVTLQWAQFNANASNTIVRSNSVFKARQIG
jgi:hypothetical protein